MYKVVDLFAGAGGLSLGFMQTKKYDVKVVGDASSPRRILDATAEAYNVVNEL